LKINQNEIILEAYDKVTVKFSSDEKTWQQVDLNADQVHTLKSKGLIYLDISNGGAINLIVNGKERGVPGKIGESFKTKVP
jgi:cytoskeleton protein RodZ